MVDNRPQNIGWNRDPEETTRLNVDKIFDARLNSWPPKSDLSDSVNTVSDLGLGAASRSFSKSFSHDWEVMTPSKRNSLVEGIRPISRSIFRKRMFSGLIRNSPEGIEYLPINTFEKLFMLNTLVGLVKSCFRHDSIDFHTERINEIAGERDTGPRRRIYGILIAMQKTYLMEYFVKERISDNDLPLRQSRTGIEHFTTRKQRDLVEDHQMNEAMLNQHCALFKNWERNEVYLFYVYQRMFLVPFFKFDDKDLCYYPLDRDTILPWQDFQHKTNGGEGIVHRVQIHPSHHDYQGPQGADGSLYFALKEIPFWKGESFLKELEALQRNRLQLLEEEHLIRLHLTFRHDDRLYLLFEWATGNLREFWKSRPWVQPTADVIRWMSQQCHGIARAVRRIHRLRTSQLQTLSSAYGISRELEKTLGRHGDIKPNNILWFKRRGDYCNLLVLSDLGLTRYHSELTNSLVSRLDGCTPTYCAPELGLGKRISQRYDVWSLGCVFLEFCVWCLQGWAGFEEFEEHRLELSSHDGNLDIDDYYKISHTSTGEKFAEVKKSVHERIRILESLHTCPNFIKDLLRFISERMLVVDSQQRAKIDEVCSELGKIMPPPPGETGPTNENLFNSMDADQKDHEQISKKENEIELLGIGREEGLISQDGRHAMEEEINNMVTGNTEYSGNMGGRRRGTI